MDVHKLAAWAQILSFPAGAYCAYGTYVNLHPELAGGPTPVIFNPTVFYISFGAFGTCLILVAIARAIEAVGNKANTPKLKGSGRHIIGKILEPIDATALENTFRSEESATPTSIRFINKSTSAVDIYWLNFSMARELQYTGLGIGANWTVNTFLTHPFLIVASGTGTVARGSGSLLAGFEALTTDEDIAIITDGAKQTNVPSSAISSAATHWEGRYSEKVAELAHTQRQLDSVTEQLSQEKQKTHNLENATLDVGIRQEVRRLSGLINEAKEERDRALGRMKELEREKQQWKNNRNPMFLPPGATVGQQRLRKRAIDFFAALNVPQRFALRAIHRHGRVAKSVLEQFGKECGFDQEPAVYLHNLRLSDLISQDGSDGLVINAVHIDDVDVILKAWLLKISDVEAALL